MAAAITSRVPGEDDLPPGESRPLTTPITTPTLGGKPIEVILQIRSTPEENGNKPSSTSQKISKIASILFIALGVILIVAGVFTFGFSAAAGGAMIVGLTKSAELLVSGSFLLLAGSQLFSNSEKSTPPKLKTVDLGSFSFGF